MANELPINSFIKPKIKAKNRCLSLAKHNKSQQSRPVTQKHSDGSSNFGTTDLLDSTLDNLEDTQTLLKDSHTSKESATSTIAECDVFKMYCNNSEETQKSDMLVETVEKSFGSTRGIFSQFLDNSQVMENINAALSESNASGKYNKNIRDSELLKRKSSEGTVDDDVCRIPKIMCKDSSTVTTDPEIKKTSLEELFIRNDLDVVFAQIETSIYLLGADDETSTQKLPDKVIDMIIDTAANLENNKNLQNTTDLPTTQTLANISWNEDSVLNPSRLNASFSSAFRNALLANAAKQVTMQTNLMKISEDEPVFTNLGPFYGLPLKVKDLIRQYKGIDSLYDWQDECLNLPTVIKKSNLIYALPTSGGKTLVAEILILKELLCYKKNAIFILPFVAIVQEKVWSLSPFAVALDFLVEEYASSKGTYPPRRRRRKNSVYIATIEKALGLINSLIETDRMNEIGLIVVDELHLVGEVGRGPTLEGLLTKLMYMEVKIQIIGMSATIGNIKELCSFLNAEVYSKNFRPVELTEYVKCGDEIAKINWNSSEEELLTVVRKANFKYSEHVKKLDCDMLAGLVMEVIPKGSCLIFCSSKKSCQNVASLLSNILFKSLRNYRKQEKEQILQSLKGESGSMCDILKFSVMFGVAYHHSGLTTDERRIIEDGFRAGIISVICCTSTLAAGVNLPAQRVILREPYVGREFISLSKYKQMVGRAGRAGLGVAGDSILICTNQDLPKVRKLLLSPMDQALSSIHKNEGKGLRQVMLSCIALGIANTRQQLQGVTKKTLAFVQNQDQNVDFKKLTDQMIRQLFQLGALQTSSHEVNSTDEVMPNISLRLNTSTKSDTQESNTSNEYSNLNVNKRQRVTVTNDTKLVISKLGLAAIKGGLELSRAHILYEDLEQAQRSLVLVDSLHLLYLVTPYELAEQITPNKRAYYTMLSQLSTKELQTARILGITEAVTVKLLSNQQITGISERVLNRFYLTLLLSDLWNEMPLFDAAEKYHLDRGLVQNLMQSASSFASNVVHFCEQLEEFWPFAHLLGGMSTRLSHCCVRELLPLMELPAVKQSRAKQLYNAGYKTLQSIAKASADDLVKDIEFLPKRVANQLIAASKMLLLEKVENLREEAEDVLNGVQNPTQFNMTLIK